jgi:hypothetical protein
MPLSLLRLLVCLSILLGGVARGQVGGNQPSAAADSVGQDNLAVVINEVKRGNWASVEQIVKEAGPVRAVPILHDLFANSQETEVKERIAGALVKLGDKDDAYFDFMLIQATKVVENYTPFPFRLAPEETPISKPQELSPEFVAWAKSQGLPVDSVALGSTVEEAIYTIPGRLLQLAMTGDTRAIPVLRRGLSSPNIMIQIMAARGLAQLKDNDSIPLIIDACERAPTAAPAIAIFALRSFDDPRAQSVAQSYLTTLQEAERARSAGQDTNLDPDQPKDADRPKDAEQPK